MKVGIILKTIANTRGLQRIDYYLKDNIITLKDLILNLVEIEIDRYINSSKEKLTSKEIDDMLKVGKVAFGVKYNDKAPNVVESKEVALLGFKDGLYRVFINEVEIESLDEKIDLKEDDELSFIRLTMFAGSRLNW